MDLMTRRRAMMAAAAAAGGQMESGTFTPDTAATAFSISVASEPAHLAVYSINADFGTENVWNLESLQWHADDRLVGIYRYGTSNLNANTYGSVSFADGLLTVSGLRYALRAGKAYHWFAWT